MLREDLFQSYRKGVLAFCRVKIWNQDIYYSPGALGFILREVDIKLKEFFEIEGQCTLAHSLCCLALALILGLALICFVNPREVLVYVRLREELVVAFCFDERFDMWLVI